MRIGISRCLLGDAVRYDGGHKFEPSLVEVLGSEVDWVPVCPELETGMGVPREPVRLVRVPGGSDVRMLGVESGVDWTRRMQAWAQQRLPELQELRLGGFVLKSRSPSCGLHDTPVGEADTGAGLFTAMLIAAMPDLPVEDEERLREPATRAAFLKRARARHLNLLHRTS